MKPIFRSLLPIPVSSLIEHLRNRGGLRIDAPKARPKGKLGRHRKKTKRP